MGEELAGKVTIDMEEGPSSSRCMLERFLSLSSKGRSMREHQGARLPLVPSMERSTGGLKLAPLVFFAQVAASPSPLNSSMAKQPPLCGHAQMEGTHLPFSLPLSLLAIPLPLSILYKDLALEVFVHLFLSRFAAFI
jgi:hypothetical protein